MLFVKVFIVKTKFLILETECFGKIHAGTSRDGKFTFSSYAFSLK